VAGAVVSLFRGGVYIHEDAVTPATAAPSPANGRGSRPLGTPSTNGHGLPAGDGAAGGGADADRLGRGRPVRRWTRRG
jgi:hypothetical protein